jgi:hypothetical protein
MCIVIFESESTKIQRIFSTTKLIKAYDLQLISPEGETQFMNLFYFYVKLLEQASPHYII